MYRGWTQTDYQNKHYNINQKDEGKLDNQGRDGRTNFILRIKEQETRLTLQEHDDDDDNNYKVGYSDELERIPHEADVSSVGRLVLYKCALLDDGPVRPKTCRSLHIKTLL